ncbi:hypothetical protein RvY_02976 [Ramazzottius varieornatus]|uniref:N-acetylglucosaminylphosphatidylinositol deacetylase n=1 Tax=Ramazzottius varieornatus TaxID=947166 RepID=A0A1D1UQA2_RAMVA|nr:hypothetical protein RvY_02976 [Ramazzottius varieornatus]
MLPLIAVVVFVAICISWLLKNSYGYVPSAKRKLTSKDRILLVTAHPDDECMFFGPFVVNAVREWRAEFFLLCCSSGNHYGDGGIRSTELLNACDVLGIPRKNIDCVDDPELPDGPDNEWSVEKLTELLEIQIQQCKPNVIVTFDAKGVSGHRNHRDLSAALVSMRQERNRSLKNVRLLLLDSVNVVRKYSKYLDVAISMARRFDLIVIANSENEHRVQTAMIAHSSQMLWFRWLYMFFSRYILLNTFTEVPEPEPTKGRTEGRT